MSLQSMAFAVMALTSPDICSQANEVARTIQQARNAGVPAITVLNLLEGSEVYQSIALVSYTNPPVPPAVFGVAVERTCRDALRN